MIPNRRPDLDEFLLNLQNVSDYADADWKVACEYRLKHKVRASNDRPFSLLTPIKQFDRYGLAVVFFFRFVELCAGILLLLFLIQIPCILSNFHGSGMSDFATLDLNIVSRVMKMSLANQHHYNTTLLEPDDKWFYEVSSIKKLQVLSNALSVFIVLAFIVYWECYCHTQLLKTNSYKGSPSSYTIFVSGLLENCSEDTLTEHFNYFAAVMQVGCIRNITRLQLGINQFAALFDRYKRTLKVFGQTHIKT
jgi:hypothetical protein